MTDTLNETEEERAARKAELIARIKASPEYRAMVIQGVKTRHSRWQNRMAARAADLESGKWLGVVPKSVALRSNCGDNNYGRATWNESMRRQRQMYK